MKNSLLLLSAVLLTNAAKSQTYEFDWVNGFGGTGTDFGISIDCDNDGNVYSTGSYEETTDFDPEAGISEITALGGRDIYVSKTDPDGNFQWAIGIGGIGPDRARFVKTDDSGNIYVTGYYSETVDFDPGDGEVNLTSMGAYDIFLAKYNSDGELLWANSMGGSAGNDIGYTITIDTEGFILLGSYYNGTVDFDPSIGTNEVISNGGYDFSIARYSPDGDLFWVKSMGGVGDDRIRDITVDETGDLLIGGFFSFTVDFNPDSGAEELTSAGAWDAYLLKLDEDGEFIWVKQFGGTENDEIRNVLINDDAEICLVGYFSTTVDFDPGSGTATISSLGDNDIFFAKLDEDGEYLWARALGGPATDRGLAMDLDQDGNFHITGSFEENIDFDPSEENDIVNSPGEDDTFIAKYSKDGDYLGLILISSINQETSYDIIVNEDNSIYLSGFYTGTLDFDPGENETTTFSGESDIFIAKYINEVDVTGIDQMNFPTVLSAFPNPTNGSLQIDLGTSYSKTLISLQSLDGKTIETKQITDLQLIEYNIKAPKGMYLLRIRSGDKEAVIRIVKN